MRLLELKMNSSRRVNQVHTSSEGELSLHMTKGRVFVAIRGQRLALSLRGYFMLFISARLWTEGKATRKVETRQQL